MLEMTATPGVESVVASAHRQDQPLEGPGDERVKASAQQEAMAFKASMLRGMNNIQNGMEALPSSRTSAELVARLSQPGAANRKAVAIW